MIPKVIHYCWFGDNKPPKIVDKCIESWTKILPDYEIMKWDESNYDVNKTPFTEEAYTYRNFAFVSDYARWDILYNYGGIYLDTDVLLIKDITPLLEKGNFGGANIGGGFASGLIVALEPKSTIAKEMMELYENTSFTYHRGQPHFVNCVKRETELLSTHGFDTKIKEKQEVAGMTIYPTEYFSPYNPHTGETKITDNTYAIHQYTGTWMPSWLLKTVMANNVNIRKHYKNIYDE
jgi:hypothetical protein